MHHIQLQQKSLKPIPGSENCHVGVTLSLKELIDINISGIRDREK